MIIILKPNAPADELRKFTAFLETLGVKVHACESACRTILSLAGDTSEIPADSLSAHRLVEKVIRVQEPYKMANRMFHPGDTIIEIPLAGGGVRHIGAGTFSVIAGPCSVESRQQITGIAREIKKAGAGFLRGGAFKPRSSPYSFQGLGCEGLDLLREAKKETGLPLVSELMAPRQLEFFDDVDIIQVGARNMQNFDLLRCLGGCRKPILLKRGPAATLTELLMAAEHIMAGGNARIILCERGIRGFGDAARSTLDLSAVPLLKKKSHLPVIVDPSHATGAGWMVAPLAKAAVAAGADGVMVEVHNNPEEALCDGEQAITPEDFAALMDHLKQYARIEGRSLD